MSKCALLLLLLLSSSPLLAEDDPYFWLEEIEGKRALAWVEKQNAASKEFVRGGFELPEAKGSMGWIDDDSVYDSVYVRTNFGEGTLTDSGYARLLKIWKRGTPLKDAVTPYEGERKSVSVGAEREHVDGEVLDWVHHSTSFYSSVDYLLTELGDHEE